MHNAWREYLHSQRCCMQTQSSTSMHLPSFASHHHHISPHRLMLLYRYCFTPLLHLDDHSTFQNRSLPIRMENPSAPASRHRDVAPCSTSEMSTIPRSIVFTASFLSSHDVIPQFPDHRMRLLCTSSETSDLRTFLVDVGSLWLSSCVTRQRGVQPYRVRHPPSQASPGS